VRKDARRTRPRALGHATQTATQKWNHPCELLLRAKLVPDRVGAGTQVIAHIPLSQLRALPSAQDLEDAWIRARLGEDGYLTGKDAETAACDAPVVTATLDPDVIDQMINLARTAAQAQAVGYSDTIPWYIRRAVQLRDKKCAWLKCGRPAVYCDVHHLRHKQDGGETSVDNLILVCSSTTTSASTGEAGS
jgi:HNH endonuclease